MKYIRPVVFFCLGVLFGTVVAWGSLFSWAAMALDPNDSLWDRNPAAMDVFMTLWLLSCAASGAVGVWLALRTQGASASSR
jgi:hypothetical protein